MGKSIAPSAVNPAAMGEPLQADQQRISSKGRGGGIGRSSVTERAERQHLPQTLPRGGEKIRERIRRRAKVANPAARRQRSGMKQNSLARGNDIQNQFSVVSSQFSVDGYQLSALGRFLAACEKHRLRTENWEN